jgi:NitT/TauT family transport system substrate-binding protein
MKIGASETATRGFHLHYFLAEGGLTFDDVEIVGLPMPAYFDAIESRAIDMVVVPELVLSRMLALGNVVILSKAEDEIGPYQISVLAFGQRLLQDDLDLGIRFPAAYLKGVKMYIEGKTEENLALLAEKTGEDVEL